VQRYLSSGIASNRNRKCEFIRATRVTRRNALAAADCNARLRIAKCKRTAGISMIGTLENISNVLYATYTRRNEKRRHARNLGRARALRKSSQCRPNIASRVLSFRSACEMQRYRRRKSIWHNIIMQSLVVGSRRITQQSPNRHGYFQRKM